MNSFHFRCRKFLLLIYNSDQNIGMTDTAQILKKEFRHFTLAEKPGSLFLYNNISDYTSVYTKI